MKAPLIVAALVLLPAVGSARAEDLTKPICADRPNKGASPCTVDAGHWQVEMDAADWTHDRAAGVTTDFGVFASTNFKYGVSPTLDLELNVAPYEVLASSGQGRVSGFGDLTARAKWAVAGGDLPVTLAPFLKIPTASRAIGNGAVEGGLVAPIGVSLPRGLSLTVNPEIDALHDSAGSGTHAAYALSAAVGRALGPEFAGAVEVWGAENEEPAGHLRQASFDLGLAWIPMKDQNLQLDAGTNLGLTRDTPALNVYVGLSRRF
jgi:hypothetical protein